MSHFPRIPVRYNPANQELLKSQEGIAGQKMSTDYSKELDLATVSRDTQEYRVPSDRASGNQFFRRYLNNLLDVDHAKHQVLEALHKVKDSGGVDVLNSQEKTVLSLLFPGQFALDVPSEMMAVQFRLSPEEVQMVRHAVAAHLAEEMNWQGGMGGGTVPGRSQTRA